MQRQDSLVVVRVFARMQQFTVNLPYLPLEQHTGVPVLQQISDDHMFPPSSCNKCSVRRVV